MGPTVPLAMIEAARAGDGAQIERLLETIWPDVYRLSRAIAGRTPHAEDVAQEACVTILRNIASLRNPHAFRTWFYRIVVREALRQKRAIAEDEQFAREPGYECDPSASIDLWNALSRLGAKHRAAIVLHYFEGLSTREIATVQRVPEATIRFRLMVARRELKPLLQESPHDVQTKGDEQYAL